LIAAAAAYLTYRPFIISVDSLYGFLAYKGTLAHAFNRVIYIQPGNVNKINAAFEAWWAPGQWLYPGIFNYLFGARFGVASIIVTLICTAAGFIMYYKIFRLFKFTTTIAAISLVVIFCSSTFYYSFVIYQGGEIIEFCFFPCFLFYILSEKKNNFYTLFITTTLFLLCCIAKLTLLVYASSALFYKAFYQSIANYCKTKKNQINTSDLWQLLPFFVSAFLVEYFFLSKGATIPLFHYFHFSAESILIPFSSPLCSILSIQEWIIRLGRFTDSYALQIVLYFVCTIAISIIGLKIARQKSINERYKWLLIFLFAGLLCFFIPAYLFKTDIDKSCRHFKLLGFLCIPGFIHVLREAFNFRYKPIIIALICLLTVIDIIYIKEKWAKNRYISINYFYRNEGFLDRIDGLDRFSYEKLIRLDKIFTKPDLSPETIFFIESTADVRMDMQHICIIQNPFDNNSNQPYKGNTRIIIACISKNTLSFNKNFLKNKFPDYHNFQLIDQTDNYSFIKIMN